MAETVLSAVSYITITKQQTKYKNIILAKALDLRARTLPK